MTRQNLQGPKLIELISSPDLQGQGSQPAQRTGMGKTTGLKIIFKTTSDNISDGLSFGSDIIRWWNESSSKILPQPSPPSITGDLSGI